MRLRVFEGLLVCSKIASTPQEDGNVIRANVTRTEGSIVVVLLLILKFVFIWIHLRRLCLCDRFCRRCVLTKHR